ncbi:MAG TPA: DUF167 domain-containing protein [bacterium]|nr:DUF167 domain-containing protein [bacterium]
MKLTVQITPNARKSEVIGSDGHVLKLKIAAPPAEGKANKELICFLSKLWKVPKSSLTILKGHTSRIKILDVPDRIMR